MDFYEIIRKFNTFGDFLRITALITEEYDAILEKEHGLGADTYSIEELLQCADSLRPGIQQVTDKLEFPFYVDCRLRSPGPKMTIEWNEYATYSYKFASNGATTQETRLLYETAISLFDKEGIEEVKKKE